MHVSCFAGKKLHPSEIKHLNEKVMRKAQQNDDDHELPPFVTAVRQTTIDQVTQLVASIQQHLPGRKVYVYDLDLTKDQKKEVHTFHFHIVYTPSTFISCTHLPLSYRVHTFHFHIMYTPSTFISCTHLPL